MDYVVKIVGIDDITHNVKSYKVEKPTGYTFKPGQSTEVAINKPGWQEEKRPFCFSSLNDTGYLELIIKNYTDHTGVTNEMKKLVVGDSLIIGDVWGAIEYKGPGYFIAGGAGITPFLAILRSLQKDNKVAGNKLFFSNKTSRDIICEDELNDILGKENVINIITGEKKDGYDTRYIDEAFLKQEVADFKKHFYVCGPKPMTKQINKTLIKSGASPDEVVFEK